MFEDERKECLVCSSFPCRKKLQTDISSLIVPTNGGYLMIGIWFLKLFPNNVVAIYSLSSSCQAATIISFHHSHLHHHVFQACYGRLLVTIVPRPRFLTELGFVSTRVFHWRAATVLKAALPEPSSLSVGHSQFQRHGDSEEEERMLCMKGTHRMGRDAWSYWQVQLSHRVILGVISRDSESKKSKCSPLRTSFRLGVRRCFAASANVLLRAG